MRQVSLLESGATAQGISEAEETSLTRAMMYAATPLDALCTRARNNSQVRCGTHQPTLSEAHRAIRRYGQVYRHIV